MTQVIEKTEQEQQKVYAELQRIISLAEDKVDEKVLLDLSQYRVVDQMPQGLPLMEDVIRDYISGEKYLGGETILVLARVGDIYGDPTYNRVSKLETLVVILMLLLMCFQHICVLLLGLSPQKAITVSL